MKKFIVSALIVFCAFAVNAQTTATRDAAGNYMYAPPKPKTEADLQKKATKTEATYTHKDGQKFPVWLSGNGKPFVIRKSEKTGNLYRQYLKVD